MSDPTRPKDDELERAADEAVKRFAGGAGETPQQAEGAKTVEGVAKHLAETLADAGRKVASVAEQSLSTAERSLSSLKAGPPIALIAVGLATVGVVAIAAGPRQPRGGRLLLYRAHAAAVAFADPDTVGRPRALPGFGFFVGLAAGVAIATLASARSPTATSAPATPAKT